MALEEKLKKYQEKIKLKPLTGVIISITLLFLLLIIIPYLQVNYRGMNNATEEATLENQYRATLAQIGGFAVLIGLYFTWVNLISVKEDQITEHFTRAIDQLGNPVMLQKIWLFYKTSEKHHKWDIYLP